MVKILGLHISQELDKAESRQQKPLSRIAGVLLGLIVLGIAEPVLAACRRNPHRVLRVQGEVLIQRGSNTRRAYAGANLNSNHSLVLSSQAKASIYCSNNQISKVSSRRIYPVSSICPTPRSNSSSSCGIYRTPEDSTKPYLISPRNTTIADTQPLLKWNPVEGATSYQVELIGANWSTEVEATEVRYDGEEVLKPGQRYWVTITAYEEDRVLASTQRQKRIGFTILSTEKSQELGAEIVKQVRQSEDLDVLYLTLIEIYRDEDYQLYADAITLLSKLIEKEQQGAAVYELLGQTYADVGLFSLAKEEFLTALELAEAEGNLDLQASLQGSLGEVTDILSTKPEDFQEAVAWLQAALRDYEALGELTEVEEERVAEIEKKLAEIREKIGE